MASMGTKENRANLVRLEYMNNRIDDFVPPATETERKNLKKELQTQRDYRDSSFIGKARFCPTVDWGELPMDEKYLQFTVSLPWQ